MRRSEFIHAAAVKQIDQCIYCAVVAVTHTLARAAPEGLRPPCVPAAEFTCGLAGETPPVEQLAGTTVWLCEGAEWTGLP